ncbi:MAG: hypothetical protein LQ343_007383 [Gyalolechia ehrenbergii]|nr:MAG: hypothetical protein LQ343_007383 [Gyalolechia ehrenbergii]
MSTKTISRPNGNDDKALEHPIITGFTPVASYNWLDDPDPTVLVPGCPPIWSPPSVPQPLAPDTGFRYIDQNADRYPESPLTPLFSSILQIHGTYPFETVDIISDRSPLRKLYAFAANEPDLRDFRFGVSTFSSSGKKKTIVFHRMEKRTKDEYEGVEFRGYRSGFENQYMRAADDARGSRSHYRISAYDFGGLKFLVRSGVDGHIPSSTDSSTSSVKEENITKNLKDLGFQQESGRNIVNKGDEVGTTDLAKGMKKTVVQAGGNTSSFITSEGGYLSGKKGALKVFSIPNNNKALAPPRHDTLVELITRSKFSKTTFNISATVPDLFISQTKYFVEAYHRNVGYRKFTGGKQKGSSCGRMSRYVI